ncbi:MAG: carbohydrate kinase [Hyphomicrobiaceae bacterium]|nr:carbohydrate kinase [Hyphomicrobiaceae bacterium]
MTTLIGIDIGTTAVKAVLIDGEGNRLAAFSRPHAMMRPEPQAAEQSPADWMQSVYDALTDFSSKHDLGALAGIGVCSQVNTHVFVDNAGVPLRPAIIWQDGRPAPDARAIDEKVTVEQKTEWFGGPVPIDASHALARIAFVARTEPDLFAKTRHVLLPKDYCVLELTGEVASDAISAVGLTDQSGYVAPLLNLVPRAADLLPPLFKFTHIAGRVRAGLPCAGAPVVVGAMDAWGGMFGVGVVENGDAMLQSGTSEIPGIVSQTVNPTPGVILFPDYDGIRMHAAPTQSGGASVAWFANLIGRTPQEVSALAAASSPSTAIPFFLPHLQGERAPIWDAASRGAFARIDGRAGAPEMARAVLEGVALSDRWAFEALQASAGLALEVANLGGGGSQSDIWSGIKADALGFALRRVSVRDSAALGAAILAGVGSGAMPSLTEAVNRLIQFDRVFEPDTRHKAYYDDRFGMYRELYAALTPFNARFSQ